MQLVARPSRTWMMGCWCCGLRASSVLVCCLYLLLHTAFLVINFVIMNSPEEHVNNIIAFIDTNDAKLQQSTLYSEVKPYLIKNSGEYLALPITVNLVLMVANLLAAWGGLASLALLLLPWIIFYAVYGLFAASLLVYMMVLLEHVWLRVLLFLVVAPLLVLHSGCWLLLLRLYSGIRSRRKRPPHPASPLPPTVYTPEPHAWDQPLPIWAVAPPPTAWDPGYLQQLDPRYREHSRSRSRSRRSSSHSRSQSQPSTSYRHSDSVSLSEKYGERRLGGEDRYETEDQSEYRTDGEETEEPEEETEGDTEGMEGSEEGEQREEEEEGAEEEEEEEEEHEEEEEGHFEEDFPGQYRSPRVARPKSRSELFSMPGTTLHSSSA